MIIFTPNQIQEILDIIDKHNAIFISTNIGTDFLSQSEKNVLKNAGIDLEKLKDSRGKIDEAYTFGILSTALSNEKAKNMSYKDFKKFVASKGYIPLNTKEKAAIEHLKYQLTNDLNNQRDKIKRDVGNIILDKDKELQAKFNDVVINEAIKTVEQRKSVREMVSEIGHKTNDWNRDLGRVAEYTLHNAYEEGRAAQLEKEYGTKDVLVYKDVYPGACKHCIKHYLTSGIGSQPVVFKLSELKANGTNIGKKAVDWRATLGPIHPHCFDKETDVLTREGWVNWQDIKGDEAFLSVDPVSGKSEWVKAKSLVTYRYKGKMQKFKGHAFDLMTTLNHYHFVHSKKSKNYVGRLVFGNNLTNNSAFLNIVQGSWEGVSPKSILIGDIDVDFELYCQFMGWYLSEGSCFKKKDKDIYILDVSQHKECYLDEIKKLFRDIFKKDPWTSKGHIAIYINKCIADHFIQFGHSSQKFIPDSIKEAKKEHISIFMESFRKGDGSIRIKSNAKIQSKPSIYYSTSSEKMADDLGELIIKMDFRPSYFYSYPKPINHKNGIYTSKKRQINIYQNKSKTSQLKNMNVDFVDYDDFVYDVELEKYHTLYVRRNGKVTISGNCRCTINDLPPNYVWSEEEGRFVLGKPKIKNERVKNRKKVSVKIGDQEYMV